MNKKYLSVGRGLGTGYLSVHGPKYFDIEAVKILSLNDFENFDRFSRTQYSTYAENKFDEKTFLEDKFTTPDDAEIWYKLEVDLK